MTQGQGWQTFFKDQLVNIFSFLDHLLFLHPLSGSATGVCKSSIDPRRDRHEYVPINPYLWMMQTFKFHVISMCHKTLFFF